MEYVRITVQSQTGRGQGFSVENDIVQRINIQSNQVGNNLEWYTKYVLLIRGTCHQYSLA